MDFTLTSPDLVDGGRMPMAQVYNGMGYAGENISPELTWHGAPTGTQSYALTMYDPDAPTGSGWWHWVVVGIPASVTTLPRGAGAPQGPLPHGAWQVRTDFGSAAYGGAAPPAGPAHRYILTLYALNTPVLDLPRDATAAHAGFVIHAHKLAEAKLTVMFGK